MPFSLINLYFFLLLPFPIISCLPGVSLHGGFNFMVFCRGKYFIFFTRVAGTFVLIIIITWLLSTQISWPQQLLKQILIMLIFFLLTAKSLQLCYNFSVIRSKKVSKILLEIRQLKYCQVILRQSSTARSDQGLDICMLNLLGLLFGASTRGFKISWFCNWYKLTENLH